jgi:hypothetical protein
MSVPDAIAEKGIKHDRCGEGLYQYLGWDIYNDPDRLDSIADNSVGPDGFDSSGGLKTRNLSGGTATASASGAFAPAGGAVTSATLATTSPFVIGINWDASVTAAPATFKTAVTNAVRYLEGLLTSAVTVNINVGFGEVGVTAIASGKLGGNTLVYVNTGSGAALLWR